MPKEYIVVGTFKASSGLNWWRVSKDETGALSCTCPGWCRRVAKDGSRSCKHVQKVVENEGDTLSAPRAARRAQQGSDRLGRRTLRLS